MEYRIHEQNGYKTSIISLDLTSINSNKKNLDTSRVESILSKASTSGINLISASIEDVDFIKSIQNWQKKSKTEFMFAFHMGYKNCFSSENDPIKTKKEIFYDRFEGIEQLIYKAITELNCSKIHFFSLYYAKNWHFTSTNILPLIEKVKKIGLIQSFGIYCQHLSEAIYLANLINVDHLEIQIDINSSSELLHTLFKTAKRRNIAIICHQQEIVNNNLSVLQNSSDELVKLLKTGYKIFINKIKTSENSLVNNVFSLALKKNIMEDFQSITIKISDLEDFTYIQETLNYPYLSFNESELLQRLITPDEYPSPKTTNLGI